MIIEEWRNMPGDFDGQYLISNKGSILSLHTGNNHTGSRLKKFFEDKDGYLCVALRRNGRTTSARVHRLVALAFIPNPDNLPLINHKDENKQNNDVDNLEWCTNQYNLTYGTIIQRRVAHTDWSSENRKSKARKNGMKNAKVVCQFDVNGVLIKEYPSARAASRAIYGKTNTRIIHACLKTHNAAGYQWYYKDDLIGG